MPKKNEGVALEIFSRATPEKNSRARELERRGGWIEFPKSGTKNPRRYATERKWIREGGEWKKKTIGRAYDFEPMTEDEYYAYKEKQERAKRAKQNRVG